MKDKINEPETNGKNKNIRGLWRGVSEHKKSYQPRTSVVKGENGDLLTHPHNVLNRWNNYFYQLI